MNTQSTTTRKTLKSVKSGLVRFSPERARPLLEALEDRALFNVAFNAHVDYGAGDTPRAIAAGDFNRDGRIDVVAANTQSNTINVLLGNGNGSFQPATTYATLQAPSDVAVGDFNGDGRQDVVVAHSNNNHVSVFLSNAN